MQKKLIILFASFVIALPALAIENNTDATLNKLLPEFEQYAVKSMQDWKVPGMTMAIVKDNKIVYSKGFGVKKIGGNESVSPETLFQIGSISKSFTAVLGGILVDQNQIKWKDQVVDYYPQFLMNDPVVTREYMIQDLFAQNSGLPAHVGDTQAILGYSADQILASLKYYKADSSFRSQFAYQNIFFVVADQLMESTTHKKWPALLTEHVFQPLEMKNSSTSSAAFNAASDVAALHQIKNNKVVALSKGYEGEEFIYTMGPAGGINSTTEDMAHYLLMLLNEGKYKDQQVISRENLQYLWAPKTIVQEMGGRWSFYGLGWIYTQYNPSPIVWHNGATLGHKAMIAFIPSEKIGIVILSNLHGTLLPDALAMEFFDRYMSNPEQDWSAKMLQSTQRSHKNILAEAETEKTTVTKRKKNIRAAESGYLPLKNYAGRYHNPVYGDVEIKADADNLYMIIGPEKVRMNISPLFRDIFQLHWSGAGDDLQSENNKVHFVVDIDGVAKLIYIEFFKDAAGGLFKRLS